MSMNALLTDALPQQTISEDSNTQTLTFQFGYWGELSWKGLAPSVLTRGVEERCKLHQLGVGRLMHYIRILDKHLHS